MQDPPSPSAHKVLTVLETLGASPTPQRLGDIATTTGMTKPTAHRLLRLLAEEGWATAREGGYYELGPRAKALAGHNEGAWGDSVEETVRALAEELGQTVHVGMLAGDEVLYTHKAAGPQAFSMASRVGMRMPLHCTAMGKAILADLPESEARALVKGRGLPARTPSTITDIDELVEHLALTRDRGYATDLEENEENVRCVAVPLFAPQGVVGGLSVSTIRFLTSDDELYALVPPLRTAAEAIAKIIS
jgi:IclR family transcriptional regulator, acetate operon repressor